MLEKIRESQAIEGSRKGEECYCVSEVYSDVFVHEKALGEERQHHQVEQSYRVSLKEKEGILLEALARLV
jgi:hypothetical protein